MFFNYFLGKKDHLLTLLMYCFNYEHDGWSKQFLQRCLENGSKNIVKAGINLL